MKINKLQINGFGNLENKELEFGDGINLIYGKNESGKSTIANFIKGIFYGVNRNKAGNDFSEYERYKPWKSSDFSGKIEYIVNDEKYTAFRDFNRNNCKIYDKDGKDITSHFNKDKARGSEIGAEHLGIDEETFMNTLFVGQNNSNVDLQSQKNIIQKLTNILQSGQENISFEKIEGKLQKKMVDEIGTDRTHNKPINLINKDINEKEQTRMRLLNNRNRKELLEEKLKDKEEQIEKTDQSIDQIRQTLEIKEKYIDLLEDKQRTFELTKKIKAKEKQDIIENCKKQFKIYIGILALITILVCICLVVFKKYIWIIPEVLLAIIGGMIIKYTNKIRIPEDDDTDFDVIKEELNKKEFKELEKLQQKGVKSAYLDRKAFELKTLLAGLEKNKNDLILDSHKIKIEEDSLKENIEHLTDVEEQLIELKDNREKLLMKNKIINVALKSLNESYEELKSEVIPELQNNIKEEIKLTTNDTYVSALYNNEDGILIENTVGEYVPISKLSIGTMDQMYLGFRLGIAKKLGDIPIILDESFAYYDDQRLENLLKSLKNLKKQIIILTCSKRELQILSKLKIPYDYLEI